MTNITPISATTSSAFTPSDTNHEVSSAFVIRLSWDRVSGEWCILLKPSDGQAGRLFNNVEATLLYLETIMQKEKQQPQLFSH